MLNLELDELLALCVARDASDLHLSAGLPPWLRVHGDISPIDAAPIEPEQAKHMLLAIMDEQQQHNYLQRLELDFAHTVPQLVRFRVNAFWHKLGAGAVFRTVPNQIPTLATLGFGTTFSALTKIPRGLICITGPTGSGKSTTLAALLAQMNQSEHKHIITIEDPIEFSHPSKHCLITQRTVGQDTNNFQTALLSALREDPDVILIGELRDLATARLVLTAAETGHLVLTSLHTASAAKTIDRIIDLFPAADKAIARSMLAESLQTVISQILMKKAGGGRVVAYETLTSTPAIRHLIREGKVAQIHAAIQTGAQFGMHTLEQHLATLVAARIISPEAAHSQTALS